jgi:DNA ligase-1
MGALLVELADGTRFAIGTGFSDAERESPPAIGDIVTFRYQELSDGGVPRFPSYVGVRIDASLPEAPKRVGTAQGQQPSKRKPVVASGGEAVADESTVPSVSVKSAAQVQSAGVWDGSKRCFEFVEGSSSKFWEVEVAEGEQKVRFGKIGANGQTKSKAFASHAAALTDSLRLIAEKVAKGYSETAK